MFRFGLSLAPAVLFAVLALVVHFFFPQTVFWKHASARSLRRLIVKLFSFFAALLCAGLIFANLSLTVKVPGAFYLFLFDMTFSQQVKDYSDENGEAVSRLQFAKKTVLKVLDKLPPHSRIALGGIANGEVLVFLPVVQAERRKLIQTAAGLVEWWNLWADNSSLNNLPWYLSDNIKNLDKPFNAVIFHDGGGDSIDLNSYQEQLKFLKSNGRFLIVGVGKIAPAEVPKFNEKGEKIGCLEIFTGVCYTSGLDSSMLERSAAALAGEYQSIENTEAIQRWLTKPLVKEIDVEYPLDWIFALAAIFFVVLWILV